MSVRTQFTKEKPFRCYKFSGNEPALGIGAYVDARMTSSYGGQGQLERIDSDLQVTREVVIRLIATLFHLAVLDKKQIVNIVNGVKEDLGHE